MRILAVFFFLLLACSVSIGAESQEGDHYCTREVQIALKRTLSHPGSWLSFTRKQLERCGDAVSIALLKIMDQDELAKVESVKAMLFIIRQAFEYPPAISREVDKKPNVTLFLLNHLHQDVSDAQVRSEIQQTIEFVKKKSSE